MTSLLRTASRFSTLLLILGLFSCGDDSTSPPNEPEPDHVTRETANSTSEVVGPAGGTLQTTANDGTAYTLAIPPNALATGINVTMTPITAVDGYPLAGGVVGGVELKPSGTVFAAPVTLEIESTETPDAGQVPVAILFTGNAASFEPSVAGSDNGTFIVPMTHFSGGTVGFATAQELANLASLQGVDCLYEAFVALQADGPTAMFDEYLLCFQLDILPLLEDAANDRSLAIALGKYSMWKTDSRVAIGIENFVGFDDAAETAQALDVMKGKLVGAIDRNNQKCEDEESLAALANVLFWQSQATRFGLDSPANFLDRAKILRDLCAHPVIDSATLPADLQVGFPHSIDIEFGLLFNSHQNSQGVPFEVHLLGDGIDVQHPVGFTNTQGKYTSVITATREGDVSIIATACLVYPGTQTASDVCITDSVSTDAINLDGSWSGEVFPGDFGSDACMTLNQNQNAVTGTVHQFGGTATFTATLSGHQLLNVSIDGFFGEGSCTTNGTGTTDGTTITLEVVPDAPCNTELTIPYTFTRGTCPPPTRR